MATSILHVCEAGGGGVLTALNGWIHSAREFDHTIFISRRSDSFSELVWPDNVEWIVASDGFFDMAIKYRKLLKGNEFDLIHFHSTKAGFLRIFNHNSVVIYSPHCFAFERNGRKGALNVFIYLIEKILARSTRFFAAVSERERYLALRLNSFAKVELVSFNVSKWVRSQPKSKIVSVGRLCYQKDPNEFIEIVNLLRMLNPKLEFVWIGDGDLKYRQSLTRNGVRVTGWIEPSKLIGELKDAALLLHTARWEGMPVVFAEALAGGIPLVVRYSKYLANDSILEEISFYETRFEAVQMCEDILSNDYVKNPKQYENARIPYNAFLKKIVDGWV